MSTAQQMVMRPDEQSLLVKKMNLDRLLVANRRRRIGCPSPPSMPFMMPMEIITNQGVKKNRLLP
jgi:hypothetical protein